MTCWVFTDSYQDKMQGLRLNAPRNASSKGRIGWLLRPGVVTVYLHDVIETKDLRKNDVPALRDRVHAIISRPISEDLDAPRKN